MSGFVRSAPKQSLSARTRELRSSGRSVPRRSVRRDRYRVSSKIQTCSPRPLDVSHPIEHDERVIRLQNAGESGDRSAVARM